MTNAISYGFITAAAVAAAKVGVPHLLAPYVAMIQHATAIISTAGR
jgi:hypothetical protein